jgi:hypothetical protein
LDRDATDADQLSGAMVVLLKARLQTVSIRVPVAVHQAAVARAAACGLRLSETVSELLAVALATERCHHTHRRHADPFGDSKIGGAGHANERGHERDRRRRDPESGSTGRRAEIPLVVVSWQASDGA